MNSLILLFLLFVSLVVLDKIIKFPPRSISFDAGGKQTILSAVKKQSISCGDKGDGR